jgi:ubiquinone/menaquinone biosynthesis C-methylase UbiE
MRGTRLSPFSGELMRWNVEEYQRVVFQRLALSFAGTERVLDIGCGDGADTEWLARQAGTTLGIDLIEHPRWKARSRPDLRFQRADAKALPYEDHSFDLVFMKDVLHHCPSPLDVLLEARRVSSAGGGICIVEANRLNPIFYLHMTLMLGHQHFRRPVFRRLVTSVFPDARFFQFEAHVYPFSARPMIALTRVLQAAVARTPLIERFASYNAAIATT